MIDRPFAPLTDAERASNIQSSPADGWTPVLPVPASFAEPSRMDLGRFAPAGFTLTDVDRYWNHDGALLLGLALRFDKPANGKAAEKQVKILTCCDGPGGKRAWRLRGFPDPRPLYALEELSARPQAPVLVVEGEKTARGAQRRFRDFVVVTSPGGSSAAHKADWTPLSGRAVIVWPDHDDAGRRYSKAVAEHSLAAGASSVRIVAVPDAFPEAWDLADAEPEDFPDVLKTLLDSAQPFEGPGGSAAWAPVLPIESALPPVVPFTADLLPEPLRDYVMDVAERQQSSPDFVAVSALCGLAAVVGNKVRIRPKQNDDWTVVPNLWGANIGRPSAMKSPAMQSALGPLYALQEDMRKEWEELCRDIETDDALAGLEAKDARKRAEKAMKSGDRDEARRLLKEAKGEAGDPPPCPRLIINDATVEAVGVKLNENPNGLIIVRDELPGFLSRMESEEYQGERAFYLEAFNGDGQFTYDRIGRGTVHIANCTLSMIGNVQPSRIAPIVHGAVTGARNDGLIQRLQLAVWPDDRPTWEWVDRRPSSLARQAFEEAFRKLRDIPRDEDGKPAVVFFTAGAQQFFREWVEEIQREARGGKLSSTLESHVLKMPKTVASLALIFELVENGVGPVGETSTVRALAWADYLRTHADRLYAAGQTMIEEGAKLIVERRRQLPEPFTARAIHQKGWANLTEKDVVAEAIVTLIETNHCREAHKEGGAAGGRPSVSYVWNPSLRQAV